MTTATHTDNARRDDLYVPIMMRVVDVEADSYPDAGPADVWTPPILGIVAGIVAAERGIVMTTARRDLIVAALLEDDAEMRSAMAHLTAEEL